MPEQIYKTLPGNKTTCQPETACGPRNRPGLLLFTIILTGCLAILGWLAASPAAAEVMDGPITGNINSWLLLGPLPNGDQGTRLAHDYLGNEVAAAPYAGQADAGSTWTAVNFPAGDALNLESYYTGLGLSPYYSAFYAFVWINSPTARTVRLEAGSDDGIQVLINGARALYQDVYRGVNIGNPDQAEIYLQAGWNRMLVKVSQGSGGTGFFALFVNTDGTAIDDLTWSLNPEAMATPDDQGPVASLEQPADLADPTPTLTGVIHDLNTGNSPVTQAEFRVDGGDWLPASLGGVIGNPERPLTVTTPRLGNGSHTVELRGLDVWSNLTPEASYASISFTLQLDPRQAAQRGLDWVLPAVTQWTNSSNCLGCHVQGVTLYGAARAAARGFSVDLDQLKGWADKMRAWQEPDGRINRSPGNGSETTVLNAFTTMGLSAFDQNLGPDYTDVLVKEADWIVSQQQADGHWVLDQYEPPVDQGDIMVTASNVVGLAQARQRADSWRAGIFQGALEQAMTWLRAATPTTNQDKAYLLLGLLAGGAGTNDAAVTATYQDLLDDQHLEDGGWAERDGLQSNAFATGQALYALRQAGLAYDSSQANAAFEYLARTQDDDGSWGEGVPWVNTDAGRPSRFLSTIWPVVALSNAGERRYGVELSASPNGAVIEPGANVQYSITILNTSEVAGMGADTFSLEVTAPLGWTAELDNSSVTLTPGASTSVLLTVTAPASPAPGEVGLATVRAVSSNAAANNETVFNLLQVPSRTPDRVGPAVTLNQAFSYTGDDTLQFTGSASDSATGNAHITSVEYQLDATVEDGWLPAALTEGDGTSTAAFQFSASGLTAGEHTIHLRAQDAAGNYTAAAGYAVQSVTVLYRGPVVTLEPVLADNPDNTPRIKGTASDVDLGNAAVQQVEYQVDSTEGPWLAATISQGAGTASVNFWLDSTALAAGQHTIHVRAVDSLGIATEPESIPAVSINVLPADAPQPLNGFVRSWLLGSVDGYDINQEMIPYQAAVTPSAGDTLDGMTWEAAGFSSNLIDLNDYYNPGVSSGPPDYKTGYAHLYIHSATEQTGQFRQTSDDGLHLWLNGQLVINRDNYRGLDPNNLEASGPVTFNAGWNNLVVKINELHSPWGFALRITDEASADLSGLTYQLNRPADLPTTGPEVSLDELALTEDITPTITGQAVAASDTHVAYVEYQVDGAEAAWQRANQITASSAGGANFSFTTQPLEMGVSTLSARAMDQWGNWGTVSSTQVEVRYNPFEAAQRGLTWLIPQVRSWTDNNNCLGCHVQGIPLYGAAVAKARGYQVDTGQLDYLAQFIHDAQTAEGYIDRYRQPSQYGYEYFNDAYAQFGLAAYDRLVNTQYGSTLLAAADFDLTQQQADGHWTSGSWQEAPVAQGDLTVTGAIMTALARAAQLTTDADKAAAYQAALEQAATWLTETTASTTQDKAFKLLGLIAAGRSSADPTILDARQALVNDQLADGGWAERSGLQSNSYATGEAVYALRLAGLGSSDQAVSRGLAYLVRYQQDDGTWNEGVYGVHTDAGRPSSFTATIWAVIALGDVAQYAVTVQPAAGQPLSQSIQPGASATYNLQLGNASEDPFNEYDLADTYDLTVSVDQPGWTAELNPPTSLTLAEGVTTNLILTVTAPAGVHGQTATFTVTATSQGAAEQGGSATSQLQVTAATPALTGGIVLHVTPSLHGDAAALTARSYSEAYGWLNSSTDSAGNFTWTNLQPGTYSLQVQGPGYLTRQLDNIQVVSGQTTELDTALLYGDLDASDSIGLPDLQAVAAKFGRKEGDQDWDQQLDIVADGRINLFDLVSLSKKLGSH